MTSWEQSLPISNSFLVTCIGAVMVTAAVSVAMFLYLRSGPKAVPEIRAGFYRFQYRLAVVLCVFLFLLGSYAVFWDPLAGRVVYLQYDSSGSEPLFYASLFILGDTKPQKVSDIARMQYVWKSGMRGAKPTYHYEFFFNDGTKWTTAPLNPEQIKSLEVLILQTIPEILHNARGPTEEPSSSSELLDPFRPAT